MIKPPVLFQLSKKKNPRKVYVKDKMINNNQLFSSSFNEELKGKGNLKIQFKFNELSLPFPLSKRHCSQ